MAVIGVVCHNHSAFTQLTLRKIQQYTDLSKHRLILVDNQSSDSTVKDVEALGFIDKIYVNDENNLPKAQNIIFKEALKYKQDPVFVPNDVAVGPSWLELLREDVYRYENVGCGSPYMPMDCLWDEKVNVEFMHRYFNNFYSQLKTDPSVEGLSVLLDKIYDGNFENFVNDFQSRNATEPPLDCSLTHLLYYKLTLVDEIGFYDEEYKPYGNEDIDYFVRMNNAEIFRICSSRAYAHHWLSITDRNRFKDDPILDAQNKTSCARLSQKWEFTHGREAYLDVEAPSNIPEWKTPYPKFRRREGKLSVEDALKVEGLPYMKWMGLHPGDAKNMSEMRRFTRGDMI